MPGNADLTVTDRIFLSDDLITYVLLPLFGDAARLGVSLMLHRFERISDPDLLGAEG